MKTMKNKIVIKGIIILVFLLIVPMLVTANGNVERPYGNLLDEEFTAIADDLEAGKIDVQTAVNRLQEFRVENAREDNADYQVMAGLLAKVQTGEATKLQAREQVQLLEECNAELTANQLQQRVNNMEKIKTQTKTQTRTQSETPTGTQTSTQEQVKSGSSSNSSTDKTKKK